VAQDQGDVLEEKIQGNRIRDCRVNRELRALDWTVIRIWEHELRRRDEAKLVRRLVRRLKLNTKRD
jgi:DNA mismatch endonuclease (patch repair protein)